MNGPEVLDVARQGIWVMLIISLPMMVAGLVVGLIVALFQALTQIQEQTLVFVPKIVAVFLVLLISLPFIGATMGAYMNKIVDLIVASG